jgi:uncharacterized protein YndB with AHSA1/START domain
LLRVVLLVVDVSLQGKFEEMEPGKRLVFSWRFNNWEDGCFSKVRWCHNTPQQLHAHLYGVR